MYSASCMEYINKQKTGITEVMKVDMLGSKNYGKLRKSLHQFTNLLNVASLDYFTTSQPELAVNCGYWIS